ncbi:MAG: hypothetical protein QXO54_04420 [Candidatus Methanomethylicaceae archaeon]
MGMSSELKETIGELIKILNVLRKTSPNHQMGDSQKEEVIRALDSARRRLEKLREGITT